jgi:hypothetical protein
VGQRVEHRQVERERLPGRRAGGDDRVALACGSQGLGLMRVQAVDTGAQERLGQLRMETVGKRLLFRRPGAVAGLAHELLVAPVFDDLLPREAL